MTSFHSREAAQRFAERRRREDGAPRLAAEVPALATLTLAVEERRASVTSAEARHVRYVMVDRAPALFVIPCGDPSCEGGGYDLTTPIMNALRTHSRQFTAGDECLGSVGTARCSRNLKVVGTATFRS